MSDKNQKVAGYVRVSTQAQKEDNSHIRQKEELEKWAESNGYNITLFEDIAVSGQSTQREGYEDLMNSYENYEAVVVRELSRFGRSPEKVISDVLEIAEETEFISLKEDEFNTETAQGRLFLRILSAFNGFFADVRREQAEELYQKKMEKGEDWGRPKKLTGEALQDAITWRKAGLSYEDIASLLELDHNMSISRPTLTNTLKEEMDSEQEGGDNE